MIGSRFEAIAINVIPFLRRVNSFALILGLTSSLALQFNSLIVLAKSGIVLAIAIFIIFFTGYSSLSVALALPEDGKVIACDVSEEYTSIARRYWEKAEVAHKIDLYIAPAIQTLDRILAEGQANTFDFAFIDADKENYDGYYERSLQLVRKGGLIAIDNVLWSGRVIDPEFQDADTLAIHALNEKLHQDQRISLSLLPVSDGLTLALKL
ncbi:MAG: class I SAM-dependent methyltransferase [Pseudanabaena sp. CoA8_M7]|nr:class I SAM-dependent methyltransferase [Pseudanabaena mucicola]MCE2978187.1 class I SAM-dependent methyltransferase [Pseudanabaena sp. CoA8_M7]